MLSLDKGENVFLVLLNLSVAFDTVWHQRNCVLQWFDFYLSQRTQFVNIYEANSTVRDLPVGVPQGSVLGPILYLMYTAPLAKVIRSYGLDYHLYADDIQLYFAFKLVDVDATKSRVENCISAICRWMDPNELELNHDKKEVMLIHSKYRPSPSLQSLCVRDESVAASQSARSLGVIFDEHMSFHARV